MICTCTGPHRVCATEPVTVASEPPALTIRRLPDPAAAAGPLLLDRAVAVGALVADGRRGRAELPPPASDVW